VTRRRPYAFGHFYCAASGHLTESAPQLLPLTRRAGPADASVRSLTVTPLLPPFLHRVDPLQLQLLLLCKCANTTKCTPPYARVLAFSQSFFKELATQLATPLDPNNDAKLDHSSGTR
jgi:hypothetical protein